MSGAGTLFEGARRPLTGAPEHRSDAAMRAVGRGIVTLLLFTSVALIFVISPMALFDLGVSYGDAGGSFIEKIHPGTWIAGLALMCAAIGRGNPLHLLDTIAARRGVTIFLATWILLFVYSGLIQKVPATPFVDTFLLPIILFLLVNDASDKQKKALALLIHLVLTVNAALAIYEYLSDFRLTPQTEAMGAIEIDWRATALLGHPLANAAMAGAYALALCIGGGRDIPALLRPPAVALQLVAMVTFGGRASLVTTLIFIVGLSIVKILRVLRGGRIDLFFLAVVCLALPLVATAGIAAAQSGFFDQMIDRFISDNGSASTRVIMFKLFDIFPPHDLIVGPNLNTLSSVQYLEGLDYGIESFWIGFILTDGLAISLIFFTGLAAFCWDLVRVTRPATVVLLVSFFGVASTSVSLSAKTCLFAMLVALVLTMMRPVASGRLALAGARR